MPPRKHERVSERRAEAVAFWQETNAETREQQKQALLDGIQAVKVVSAYCPKCRGYVKIERPDLRSINDAIQTLNRLAGDTPRPGEDGAGSVGLVLKRIIVPPSEQSEELAESNAAEDPVAV